MGKYLVFDSEGIQNLIGSKDPKKGDMFGYDDSGWVLVTYDCAEVTWTAKMLETEGGEEENEEVKFGMNNILDEEI